MVGYLKGHRRLRSVVFGRGRGRAFKLNRNLREFASVELPLCCQCRFKAYNDEDIACGEAACDAQRSQRGDRAGQVGWSAEAR